MNAQDRTRLSKLKQHIIIYTVIIVVVLISIIVILLSKSEQNFFLSALCLIGLLILAAIIVTLLNIRKLSKAVEQNGDRLDKIIGTLEKSRAVLTQINQNTRLTEIAKAIAFRDTEKQSLRAAVFDKLQQQDFEGAEEIIKEIANSTGYQQLAKHLRIEADKYHAATEQERINQVVSHIEELFEQYQWTKASMQVERLISTFPDSKKARTMREKLVNKKQERKNVLLTAWDNAVKRQDTDRSIEILRELDLYLTPNEGLALQEAARDVFMNKLHSLGVRFAMAVSEKQWAKAVEAGQEIIKDFPNSKMAEEIREKIDELKEKIDH